MLGIGPASLHLDAGGTEVPIVEQILTASDVDIRVRLPDGQVASVSSPSTVEGDHVRVRLLDGARTPA